MAEDCLEFAVAPIGNQSEFSLCSHVRLMSHALPVNISANSRRLATSAVWLVLVVCCSSVAMADATNSIILSRNPQFSLHQRIDALIGVGDAKFESQAAANCSDAEFLRRIYLDLTGTIPSLEQAKQFLDNQEDSRAKRARLVDDLLSSPRHARHLAYEFDAMTMERRLEVHVPPKEWHAYLRQSFLDNKPLDQLVLEILSADGADPELRPAARFYLDRKLDVDVVTRDIGRIFLGMDLECAQCHDHPIVDDYAQRYYYGLSAFLKRSYLFKDPTTKQTVLAEKAEGDVTFTSVFTNESDKANPGILNLPEIMDPEGVEKAYLVAPTKKVGGIPAYSRRQRLAWAMVDAANIEFRRNWANRLWAMMIGRGLVEPLDMRHGGNPPSHPELLDLLAEELLLSRYDIRYILREVALSGTYQRSSRQPSSTDNLPAHRCAVGLLKPLSPEQLAWSMMAATEVTGQQMLELEAKLLESDPKFGPGRRRHPLWREQALHDALAGSVAEFVNVFASEGVQSSNFDATAGQGLFVLNSSLIQSWLVPQPNNLIGRLIKIENIQELPEELYLTVLTRRPTQQEVRDLDRYLGDASDRVTGLQDLVWAMLSSAEFRFNH